MTTEACRQISAVATHINEHIKQQDNFIKMLAIQKSLSGTAAPRLLIPGRMFIKEGALRKVGHWKLGAKVLAIPSAMHFWAEKNY